MQAPLHGDLRPGRTPDDQITILTLGLDPTSQAHFEALRQRYFPAALNRIAAHVTLFHALPASDEIRSALLDEAAVHEPFAMQVSGVRTLGRGVAYFFESAELKALHRRLASSFAAYLSPQDQQGFRPHVVVQNKVDPAEAKLLHAELSAGFAGWPVEARGLEWWDYLRGPWAHRERFAFGAQGSSR